MSGYKGGLWHIQEILYWMRYYSRGKLNNFFSWHWQWSHVSCLWFVDDIDRQLQLHYIGICASI